MIERLVGNELYLETDEVYYRINFGCNPALATCSKSFITLFLPVTKHRDLKVNGYSLLLRRAEVILSGKWVGPVGWIRQPTLALEMVKWDGGAHAMKLTLPYEERWVSEVFDVTPHFAGPGVTGNIGLLPFSLTVIPAEPWWKPSGDKYVIEVKLQARASYRVVK